MLVEAGAWSDGTVIRGKYRILSKVGQGGMGAVYKALHVAFDELRALKVISPELMRDELFVKRFKHEAVITRRLQHPNAVRVDDIDEAEDGRPFIVMEFIEGQSLRKLIEAQGGLPVSRVCTIVKQVAAALDAAHRLGMIHRDIKPDNVVLVRTPEGEQAKVLDFGIAKIKEGRLGDTARMTLTGTGVVIGTPQYMSPEQAMGKRGDELDGRSDLYSLGVVMYHMLTGDLPFKADTTMEMLLAHLQKPPTPIHVLRPELQIPEAIVGLVMKVLEKDRDMRPASAAAFIEEIARAETVPVRLEETRVVQPTARYSPRPAEALKAALEAKPVGPRREPSPPAAVGGGLREAEVTVPIAVRPAPAPVPRPAPVERPAPAPGRAETSRWAVWAAVAILVVGIGGGVWYFTSRGPTSVPEAPSTTPARPPSADTFPAEGATPSDMGPSDSSAVPAETPQQKSPTSSPTTGAEAARAAGGRKIAQPARRPVENAQGRPTSRPLRPTKPVEQPSLPAAQRVTPPPRPERAPLKPPVNAARVSEALTMGNFYLERGEYDHAIAEYQRGLQLDPTNQQLLEQLQRARRAKTAEQRILR